MYRSVQAAITEAERQIELKRQKSEKKKKQKAKLEQQRAEKAAVVERQRAEEENRLRLEAEVRAKEEAVRAERLRVEREAQLLAEKAAVEEARTRKEEEEAQAWSKRLGEVRKRLKAVQKKLREIGELEGRVGSVTLTAEQRGKIGRKQELLDEVAELEEQEEDLQRKRPSAELLLFVEQTQLATRETGDVTHVLKDEGDGSPVPVVGETAVKPVTQSSASSVSSVKASGPGGVGAGVVQVEESGQAEVVKSTVSTGGKGPAEEEWVTATASKRKGKGLRR